ncbi:hypothetical protein ACFY78_42345 [Streptomyces olindensis]|uniref:hypothetical protein n=1 Tax=Streptomyces olindensis TaxID=358823 RepID=UPI0036CC306C
MDRLLTPSTVTLGAGSFDVIAETLPAPEESGGAALSPFAEPVSRINEAVKMGRTQEAAETAEYTVPQTQRRPGARSATRFRVGETDEMRPSGDGMPPDGVSQPDGRCVVLRVGGGVGDYAAVLDSSGRPHPS